MRFSRFPLVPLVFCSALGPAGAADENDAEAQALSPVMVTAPLQRSEVPLVEPVNELSGDDLRAQVSGTIGATIQQQMGVNSASFGPGVGQPVLRGQTGPRVRMMQDATGAADASSLSPDHRVTVEPLLADKIEVMRGPATLMYSGNAIGGAVNVIDNRIPSMLPKDLLNGVVEQRYDTALDETATVMKLDAGRDILAVHFDGYYRDSADVLIPGRPIDVQAAEAEGIISTGEPVFNPAGYIPNTQTRSYGGTAGFSLIGDQGFAGMAVNYLQNDYGIPGIAEMPAAESAAAPFVNLPLDRVAINQRSTRYDFKSEWYDPAEFAELLKLRMTYTDYYHVELENGQSGTVFTNQGWEGRAELKHKPLGPMQGVVGFQGISSVFEAVGEEAVVPKSDIQNFGGFLIENVDTELFSYQAGARVEHQTIVPVSQPGASHTPVSVSGSVAWNADEANRVALALSRAQRAPQVQELYSDGFHAATRSFEIGDPQLSEETTYNLELSYRLNTKPVRANLNVFQNWTADYIYAQRTGQLFDAGSESFVNACPRADTCVPVFQFSQADASFIGYEADVGIPLVDASWGAMDLVLFSDYVRGQFSHAGDVPRQPPLRFGFELDYHQDSWSATWRVMRAEAQDRPGFGETPTPGYVLMNILVEYKLSASPYADLLLFAKGNNLLNQEIRNSTSYLRNIAPEPGIGGQVGLRASF